VLDTTRAPKELSSEEISAIGHALSKALPPGDFSITENGALLYSEREQLTAWGFAGRLDALRRDER
jgi:hypothetical protein